MSDEVLPGVASQELARELSGVWGRTAALNQLAATAARLLRTTSAHVSLISDVQSVVGGVGLSQAAVGCDSPAEDSFCSVTVRGAQGLAIADAATDPRVAHLPSVRAGAVGCYLGFPLFVDGRAVGALCVYDQGPRAWSEDDARLIEQLAASVVAELQLAASSEEYDNERLLGQLAVDAADVGTFDWNLQTGDLRWDERLLELFGIDRDGFGRTIEAFNASVHADDRERVTQALTDAIASCGRYAAEYRVVLPDASIRWVAARGRALAGPDGSAVRVLGAAYDTTAVQDGEARVSRVLEAMPTAFFQLDPQWRFTYVNTQGRRLLGGIGEELLGGVVWELFPDAVGSEFEVHYRRAVELGEPVEFEAYYPPPLDTWYEVRGWPTPDGLSVYFMDITDRKRDQDAAARATERTVALAAVSEALAGTLDIEEAVGRLAQAVVGPLAQWSVVTLADHPVAVAGADSDASGPATVWRRGLHDVAGWHADPERRALVERYRTLRIPSLSDQAFLARTLRRSRPVVVTEDAAVTIAAVFEPGEARDLCLELAPRSAAFVPLRGRGRTVGVLSVFRGAESGPFTNDDIDDLVDAAGRAGLALDNARLYAEQRDLAESLQRSLMTAPPQSDHLHVAVRYQPAAEAAQVGGDWYDAFLQPAGATSIVIGDVIGHDAAAAAAMGQVRGLLRGIAVTTGDGPADVLRRVDEAMETLQVETTATAIVARLEQTEQEREDGVTRLRWANAGHLPPLVAVHGDGADGPVEVTTLWPERYELLLGLDPSTARSEAVVELPRNSTVLLYTDGLVERRGTVLDAGVAELEAVLTELLAAGLGLEELCDELLRRLVPERPEDDVAIVAVRLHPEDGPRPPEAGAERMPPNVPRRD